MIYIQNTNGKSEDLATQFKSVVPAANAIKNVPTYVATKNLRATKKFS
jgi:hypothetical protein